MAKHVWLVGTLLFIAGSAFAGDFIDQCATGDAAKIRALIEQGAEPNMFGPGESWPPSWKDTAGEPIFATTLHRFNADTPFAALRRDDRNTLSHDLLAPSLGSYVSFHSAQPTGTAADGARRLMAEVNRASLLAALANLEESGSFESALGMLASFGLDGMRPLAAAALHNRNPEVTKTLIEAGAEVDFPAGDGATPLMLAAIGNAPGVVQVLLDAGADIHASTKDGDMTALRLAAACNPDAAVTALLLKRGAFSKGENSRVLAYAAGLNPNPEVCKLLLAKGLSPTDSAVEFKSALAWAAGRNPNPEVTALLLQKAGKIADADLAGILAEALGSNPNREVVETIFRQKADWSLWSEALLAAALAHPDSDRVRLLLSAGMTPNAGLVFSLYHRRIAGAAPLDALLEAAGAVTAKEYESALFEFVRRRNSPELVLTMLKHRRLRHDDPDAWDILQRILFTDTPSPENARLLMREGVRLKQPPHGYPEGFDPRRKLLSSSLRAGKMELARELLAEGVDANPCSDTYNSSDPDMSESLLAIAAVKAPALIPLLLEKGADPRRGHQPEKLLSLVADHCPRYRGMLAEAGAMPGEEKRP